MLDTITKKRIDDCRDILVGKLPDPKAQIEQITIGLIYKFMDDMDKEVVELGGKAKFFSNYTIPDPEFPNNPKKKKLLEFEKYAWDNLFNSRVTASEMLTLYSEAIAAMDKNPNIPQLFRDIFKNAYLPYRDPETLKLFLKTISEFKYTHSEKLGDAFEYLLSVMGSQGDAGQFRTPRHIIDFLVAAVDPGKTDTILDPACGTAGFLISAFKTIKEKNNKGLTPDERKKLIQNFVGYDISPDMVRLSLVNLYLHGFSDPHIWEYDTLSSEERWNENFDVILANPPFMSPKGGIRPHKKFTITSNRSEVLFVDYIAEHLNPKGRAGIIVPEGVIFQSGTAYKDLRKMLVERFLYAVVSLPAGVFNPYSGVKTSILLMDKNLATNTKEILFVKIDNDGYNLGAQRGAVKGSQLEEAIALLKQFKEGKFAGSEFSHIVQKSEVEKNADYNLSGERYKIREIPNSEFQLAELGNLCELMGGGTPSKTDESFWNNGDIKWISSRHINNFGNIIGNNWITQKGLKNSSSKVAPKNSIIFITRVSVGKHAIAYDDYAINQDLTAVVPKDNRLSSRYLYAIAPVISNIIDRTAVGIGVRGISRRQLSEIKIPVPPLSIQQEIVSEIEGYQKIIDGAKMIVDNYKPKIDIDPHWAMVELGEVCELNPKKSELTGLKDELEVSFVPMADLNENQIYFTSTQTKPLGEVLKGYTYFKDDDVLLAKVTPCFENGKAGIAKNLKNGIGFGSSEYYVFRPNETILSTWIYLNVITNDFRKKGKLNMTGTGGLQRVPPGFVNGTLIPLPPIEIQQQIISQIEKEQELVNANKKLIEIFEQKIKDRIANVWGNELILQKQQGKENNNNEKNLKIAAEPIVE